MAKYIALERGQIPANVTPVKRPDTTGERQVMRMVEEGEVFEFNGEPGRWMRPYTPEDEAASSQTGNVSGRRGRSSTSEAASSQTARTGSQAHPGRGSNADRESQ